MRIKAYEYAYLHVRILFPKKSWRYLWEWTELCCCNNPLNWVVYLVISYRRALFMMAFQIPKWTEQPLSKNCYHYATGKKKTGRVRHMRMCALLQLGSAIHNSAHKGLIGKSRTSQQGARERSRRAHLMINISTTKVDLPEATPYSRLITSRDRSELECSDFSGNTLGNFKLKILVPDSSLYWSKLDKFASALTCPCSTLLPPHSFRDLDP